MTILNVWVSKDRALVCVDTLGSSAGALAPRSVSKMIPFVHCNAVLSGCGDLLLTLLVFWQLARYQDSFDSMADALPQIIEPAHAEVMGTAARLGLDLSAHFSHPSIVLVGWSESRGEMRGIYQSKLPGQAFSPPEAIRPYAMTPDLNESQLPPDPDSAEKMEARARKQVAWGRMHHPEFAIGGDLVIADLRADSMTMTRRRV